MKKQALHDFWLVVEIVQKETLVINIYFCQRLQNTHVAHYFQML